MGYVLYYSEACLNWTILGPTFEFGTYFVQYTCTYDKLTKLAVYLKFGLDRFHCIIVVEFFSWACFLNKMLSPNNACLKHSRVKIKKIGNCLIYIIFYVSFYFCTLKKCFMTIGRYSMQVSMETGFQLQSFFYKIMKNLINTM